jgi:hypothetical protein
MPSIILNNISTPQNITNLSSQEPLSFLDWSKRHIGILFSNAEVQYATYLSSFNRDLEVKKSEASQKLKNDYKNLIKKLQVIFADDVEFERYKSINIDSPTDLALAIPAYAKKLKEIALFYARKREELKNKKIEYNLVGSFDGLSRLLYSNLVSKFTKNQQTQFVNENPLISQSPEFSAIAAEFSLEIEELYDTVDYFEQEKSNSINPFACIFNDLCYSIFTTPISAKADPISDLYLCDPDVQTVNNLLQTAYDTYLSTSINYISGGYYVESFKESDIQLNQGNTFFYWFSGRTVYDIPEGIFKDVAINDIDWTAATGGSAVNASDMIFINAGNVLMQGAWLQDTKYTAVNDIMSATMFDGKIFKFPYPDFGTSAVGGAWSGPGVNDTLPKSKKFFPSEEDFSNNVNDIRALYWTSYSTISTAASVYLQETSLGKMGKASNKFQNADKVSVGDESENSIIYNGNLQVAWLYDFRQTQIPIRVGENNIYFPLQRYETNDELFFDFRNGQSISLSSIDVADAFSGSVAGETIDQADTIIKNQTICGPEIECAWLKSTPLRFYKNTNKGNCNCDPLQKTYYTDWSYVSGGAQAAISIQVQPDDYVRFIWSGDSANINDVRGFTGFVHDDSCPYKYLDHSVSFADKSFLNSANQSLFEQWKNCSCQAVQHSPFGHTRNTLNYFKFTPDFIVKDLGYPANFNKKTWVGSDGKDYEFSQDSARFFPTNLIEPDMGWGKGLWQTQTKTDFILEKGKSYIYHRTSTNNCNFQSPYIIINDRYANGTVPNDICEQVSYIPQWFKAIQDESGNWIDAGVPSDMILNFGDFLAYNHKPSASYTQNRLLYSGVEINSVSGDYFTHVGDSTNISYQSAVISVSSVNFLIKIPINSYNYIWGVADYGDSVSTTKNRSVDSHQFKVVFDYLQITQPEPSNIRLNDKSVIQYNFGNCNDTPFIWKEPVTFTVYSPVRKWNEVYFDDCSYSEILQYLNKEITNCYISQQGCINNCDNYDSCPCDHFCTPTKNSVSATYIDSSIVFNTELSGLPLFVNYYSRNNFTQKFVVQDITDGEKSILVPVVSGNLITPSAPWKNLLNQNGSNFIVSENIDNLVTKKELNFYSPKKIGMNRYETFDSGSSFTTATTGLNVYRADNYFDKPFIKSNTSSKYITDQNKGQTQGTPLTNKIQTFHPYTNTFEKTEKPYYGLYNIPLQFSPWSYETGEWVGEDSYKNLRNQYKINCQNDWFTDQLVLSGDVSNWQTDIYGNQYFTVHDETIDFTEKPTTYGNIFIKLQNGNVMNISNILSSVTDIYDNINLCDQFCV